MRERSCLDSVAQSNCVDATGAEEIGDGLLGGRRRGRTCTSRCGKQPVQTTGREAKREIATWHPCEMRPDCKETTEAATATVGVLGGASSTIAIMGDVLVLDHVMADFGPVQNRASGDVRGRIFAEVEYAANRDTARPSPRVDSEFGDADQLVQNDNVTRCDVDIWHEWNGVTFMNEGGPSGNDDGVAHVVSSLG